MINLGSAYNKFKLLCVSGTVGLEVTNTPGTAKMLGSNPIGPVFFSTRKYFVSKKDCRLCFVGLVATS